MRKIIFSLLFLVPSLCLPQIGGVVEVNIKNPSEDISAIIWRLDWENKIIYDRPRTVEIRGGRSSISLRQGDWAVEYRIGGRIYSIMNLHIYGNGEYYRYTIYYGYHGEEFTELILDEIETRITYGDF